MSWNKKLKRLKQFNMFNRKKPVIVFKRVYFKTMLAGILLNALFFLIYIFIAVKTGEINFYSFFYHNIKGHIFLTILSGFHVSLLGFGILIIFIAFFNMTLKVKCFSDKFIVSVYLQKSENIEYSKIDKISIKLFYLNYEKLFQKYEKKECRVFVHNSKHIFYFAYPVKGYFDDIEINLNKKKENMDERCIASRDSIIKVLQMLKSLNSDLLIPFLPNERTEKSNDYNKRN